MAKTILITGATDGIGLETAKGMKSLGHKVFVHGRSKEKLTRIGEDLDVKTFQADFSDLSQVKKLVSEVGSEEGPIDVLINNAGVYKTSNPVLANGMDVRFVVNTIAPYLLTKELLPKIKTSGRVINLSSAAQSSVDFDALQGKKKLDDFEAYGQSKLAIAMWSRFLALEWGGAGPVVIAVNPGSLLGTKMVKEGFGTAGKDIGIGVRILTELALDEKHQSSSGKYYDNDTGQFSPPQADGLNNDKTRKLISILDELVRPGD